MIKVGIVGYGNLGGGVEAAIKNNSDMKLVAIFTRRDISSVTPRTNGVKVDSLLNIEKYKGEIDVIVNCGGSATDLPESTPKIGKHFNVIDSFDTHACIPNHFKNCDNASKEGKTVSIISVGWDPGMFSVNRLYMNSVLPVGSDYTFWGKGVSQGHSDAIRRIEGVIDARQYTVPVSDVLDEVRSGNTKEYTTREKHTRECFVVVKDGADKKRIENEIKTMPNYFSDYDTTVTFITKEEMDKNHSSLPHGGNVFRIGKTGMDLENNHTIEYSLKLDSNPEFTGSVLASYVRACKKLSDRKEYGCKTVFDIAPALLSPLSDEDIRAHML